MLRSSVLKSRERDGYVMNVICDNA
jgi:hypothetical protein